MRKITLQLIFLFVFLSNGTIAQNLIAVQNGGNPTFYTKLDSAIYYAQNEDTLYLPGGNFIGPTVIINKRLHFIGAGIHPDSSFATRPTKIQGSFYLEENSEGTSFTGMEFNDLFVCSNSSCNSVGNYFVSRCKISGVVEIGNTGNEPTTANNNTFCENILNSIIGHYSQNNTFFNNMIGGYVTKLGSNNLFRNNIFFMGGAGLCGCGWTSCSYAYFLFITNSFFENNIYLSGSYNTWQSFQCNVGDCIFRNNLFMDDLDMNNLCPGCYTYNNIDNQPQNSVFINQTGNNFSFALNYHLQTNCPGKNAGTDGTDVGVYGGYYPWKDGSMPFNPHIQFQNIYNSTDLNGNLHIDLKVSAQTH